MGRNIEKNLALYGRITTWIGTVVMVMIIVISMGVGIYLINKKDKHTKTVVATVSDSDCIGYREKDNYIHYRCSLGVKYSIADDDYTGSLNTDGQHRFTDGNSITVEYDPNNPHDIQPKPDISPKSAGWTLIGIGAIVLVGLLLNLYFVTKSNTYAQVAGVGGIINALAR